MNTKKEIVDKCYKILWEEQTSTVFDKEGDVVPRINEIIDKICRCNVTNVLTQTKLRGWILDFLYEEKTIKIPEAKRLMEDINENRVTITLDNVEDLPNTGYLEVEWNIFSYNWIDEDWTLLKVNWLNWYHPMKAEVHFAYMMPTKVLKPADIFDNELECLLKFVDFREPKWYQRCYTLKPHNGKKFAIFYNIHTPVMISYSKKLDPLESDEDECGFPDNYWLNILPNLVVWELLIENSSEVQKWERLLSIWYSALEDMYTFYATPNKQFRKKIKTVPMSVNWIDRDDLVPLRSN